MKYKVKIETFKDRRYFVARNSKGNIAGRLPVAGSKLTRENAQRRFNETGTFIKGQTKFYNQSLTNMTEFTLTKKSDILNRDKPVNLEKPRLMKNNRKQILMYQVSGYVNNKFIVANSQNSYTKNARAMKSEAWESFLERVSHAMGGDYDADEGLTYKRKISNIREGWVKYTSKRKLI